MKLIKTKTFTKMNGLQQKECTGEWVFLSSGCICLNNSEMVKVVNLAFCSMK